MHFAAGGSSNQKAYGMFTSLRTKHFPSVTRIMRPFIPAWTTIHGRQFSASTPQIVGSNYRVNCSCGVIRKDIMQWMLHDNLPSASWYWKLMVLEFANLLPLLLSHWFLYSPVVMHLFSVLIKRTSCYLLIYITDNLPVQWIMIVEIFFFVGKEKFFRTEACSTNSYWILSWIF